MPEAMKCALIGAGGIAQSYVQAFEYLPEARLTAIVDTRNEAVETMAERL